MLLKCLVRHTNLFVKAVDFTRPHVQKLGDALPFSFELLRTGIEFSVQARIVGRNSDLISEGK